jgi:hypothetical protein
MIVASSGALATPNNNCTNGNGNASSVQLLGVEVPILPLKKRSFANIKPYCGILTWVAMELIRGPN